MKRNESRMTARSTSRRSASGCLLARVIEAR